MSYSREIIGVLEGVLGAADQPVGLHEPYFDGREWEYVKDCLDTGWVSYVGSYVDLFGEKLAEKCGVAYAVPMVNGTVALQISLLLAGVERGDEVLLPSLTFVASANAVSYCGAVPHFVECEGATLGVDVQKLDRYLGEIAQIKEGRLYNKESGCRISAVVPVHIFGHPMDMDGLQAVADKYGIPVVTDAAESVGSLYKGKPAASFGLLSAVSFNGNKIITTGGGGAILTDDPDLAARAKHITTTAKVPHRWDFVHDEIGYNYRMPNVNAAIGCAQIEQLDGFVAAKRKLAQTYEAAFAGSDHFEFMAEPEYARSNYWLNTVCLAPEIDRDDLLGGLNDAGYMCRPVWRLMHRLAMYKDCSRMNLDLSEALEARIISVPSSVRFGV